MLMMIALVVGLAWIASKGATAEQKALAAARVDQWGRIFLVACLIIALPLWLALLEVIRGR
ncbi:hypothetical protein CD928_05790 [Sphingopyxis sp. GW247-27LB]|nr:hypothetical protein CD928_05790 [Sphingopyxis sp. GW247-27LB]